MMPISSPPLLPPCAPSCGDGGDAAVDEIACDRGEVLVHEMAALAHGLGVPRRSVLAAAADVGQHVGAAAGQPQPAQHTAVARGVGVLEAAVAAEQRRCRARCESRCPTTKYGIIVPSSDATKCWVTSMSEASKNAGALLISVDLVAGVAPQQPRRACRIRWSPGRSRRRSRRRRRSRCWCSAGCPATGSRCHVPGVAISTRLATSTRVTRTSRSRVQA